METHIRRLTGQDNQQDWCHQFSGDNCLTQLTLANKINDFFISLTEPFSRLEHLVPSPQEVPAELLVSETEALKVLSAVKIRVHVKIGKAVGPDSIPNKILKEFAVEPAPIVQDIFNASLSEGDLPDLLKASIIKTNSKNFTTSTD